MIELVCILCDAVALHRIESLPSWRVASEDNTPWQQAIEFLLCCLPLQVQRNWMYLENIFVGSEDIRKQLPQESQMFDAVHVTFIKTTRELKSTGNAQRACCAHGILDTFQVRHWLGQGAAWLHHFLPLIAAGFQAGQAAATYIA